MLWKGPTRTCHLWVFPEGDPGARFCRMHGGGAGGAGALVPCPIDPSHVVGADKLARHVRERCPAARARALAAAAPYVRFGCNRACEPDTPPGPASALAPASRRPSVMESLRESPERLALFLRIVRVLESRAPSSAQPRVSASASAAASAASAASAEAAPPFASRRGVARRKHHLQVDAIVAFIARAGILAPPPPRFVELGCGKGALGVALLRRVGPEGELWLVDRVAGFKSRSDGAHKIAALRFRRVIVDVADLWLPGLGAVAPGEGEGEGEGEGGGEGGRPSAAEPSDVPGQGAGSGACTRPLVVVSKHLCGEATDLALRCVANATAGGVPVAGVFLATCCHHRCRWESFCNRSFVEAALGTTGAAAAFAFALLCAISSWAVDAKDAAALETKDHGHPAPWEREVSLDSARRLALGLACKDILDEARAAFLRDEVGLPGAHVAKYVGADVTPENRLLVAVADAPECEDGSSSGHAGMV